MSTKRATFAWGVLVVVVGVVLLCGRVQAQLPLVRPSTTYISPSAQLTISGSFFATTASSNAVALSSGSCTVAFASASTLICNLATAPAFGPLYVTAVTSSGITNAYNPRVQVANVAPAPTITVMMQPPVIVGRIQELNITGTNFTGDNLAVELSSGAVYSKCNIKSSNETFITCEPEDDSGFESGALYATVSVMNTIRSSSVAIATLLPMIEEPTGGNYSIGRPPVNVPSYHIGSTSLTFRGYYLTRRTNAYTIGFTLGAGKHICFATAATARSVTCTPNPPIATLGPIIAQTNVTVPTPLGNQVLPGLPNLAAFIIPRINPPQGEIPSFVSALNVTAGTLDFTGVGFAPDKENNTVLLYPLEGAFNNDPPYLCEIISANSTAISCTIPAYMIAGTYGASVISFFSPAGPAPPKLLNVTPIVLEANATSCCFEGKYTGVLIEGAGFSINETEQMVEIADPAHPTLTSCRPIEPTFPGLSSIGNGKMACLIDYDLASIEWIENVTVTVRGFKSNTFRIKGLKKDLSDKQVLAITIVGPIVAAGVALLVALFFIMSASCCRKDESRAASAKYEPMVTIADPSAKPLSKAAGRTESVLPRVVETYTADQMSSTSYTHQQNAFAPPSNSPLYAPSPATLSPPGPSSSSSKAKSSKRKSSRTPAPARPQVYEQPEEEEQYERAYEMTSNNNYNNNNSYQEEAGEEYEQYQAEEQVEPDTATHVVSPAVTPRPPLPTPPKPPGFGLAPPPVPAAKAPPPRVPPKMPGAPPKMPGAPPPVPGRPPVSY